jgi:hypothetical protein
MLRRGATADELADWLLRAEEAMHLQPEDSDRTIDRDVAQSLIEWYERASPV